MALTGKTIVVSSLAAQTEILIFLLILVCSEQAIGGLLVRCGSIVVQVGAQALSA